MYQKLNFENFCHQFRACFHYLPTTDGRKEFDIDYLNAQYGGFKVQLSDYEKWVEDLHKFIAPLVTEAKR